MPLVYGNFLAPGPEPYSREVQAITAENLNEYLDLSAEVVTRLCATIRDSKRANTGETRFCLEQLAKIELQGEEPTTEDVGQAYFERLGVAVMESENNNPDSDDLLAIRYQFDKDLSWAAFAKQKTLDLRKLAVEKGIDVRTIDSMLQHLDKHFDLEGQQE